MAVLWADRGRASEFELELKICFAIFQTSPAGACRRYFFAAEEQFAVIAERIDREQLLVEVGHEPVIGLVLGVVVLELLDLVEGVGSIAFGKARLERRGGAGRWPQPPM